MSPDLRRLLVALILILPGTRLHADEESTFDYITIESEALGRDARVGVYLPAGYEENQERHYPTLYFLHGLFGSERKWESRGMPEILDQMIESGDAEEMIVVCPDGKNSMYVNWVSGKGRWKDFIVEDLVQAIDARYRTIPGRTGRGISGDSMGGYGAFNLAFHHPDVFGSVSAHSAALYPVEIDELPDWVKQQAARWKDVYGYPIDVEFWESNNPLHLASVLESDQLRRVKIYFDCGAQDRFGFGVTNQKLSDLLKKRDVPHRFALLDGGHGREYYTSNADRSLRFHSSVFRDGATGTEETGTEKDKDKTRQGE